MLDAEHNGQVLSVVQNTVQVVEPRPALFVHLGEEACRDPFLVQRNGQFEGGTTGDTFNAGGKTEILLRDKGRNAFIAASTFWKGSKHDAETIDPLAGEPGSLARSLRIPVNCDHQTRFVGISMTGPSCPPLWQRKQATEIHPQRLALTREVQRQLWE